MDFHKLQYYGKSYYDLNKDILLASKSLNLWEAPPRTWASHPRFTTFCNIPSGYYGFI